MDSLDRKVNDIFPGYVVRKDLVKQVRGNAAVPSYVLEFLLGQNCATDDPEQIKLGIERIKDILAKHYVQRAEAGAIRSDIKQTGFQRIIDKVSVTLNEKRDAYEASFENLGISRVLVDSDTVKNNRRLLVSGVWCIADLSYSPNEAKEESPYLLQKLKPIQMSRFDFEGFIQKRSEFTMDEWIDLLIRSIGLDPTQMGRRAKLFQLTRLVAYCERNYNLIELGPKGTGKSHVYSEFSPHGILISGGEVTPAKLFVNNSTGRIGLVGYWDCVAFDEFAGKNKRPKADIVDIMKNYMANKSFSRGIEQVTAQASMVFVGNTSHDISYLINFSDLFEDLPSVYHDPAFIDRIHAYIPGWEMDIIRGDMFSCDFGFIVDYLAEALRHTRALDYSGLYRDHFELSNTLSTRDKDGIQKTFSGLMKIIFPHKEALPEEIAELLEFCLELRKRVKDSLYRIDETFSRVEFAYRAIGAESWVHIETLEEINFPQAYHARDLVPLDGEQGVGVVDADGSFVGAVPAGGLALGAVAQEAGACLGVDSGGVSARSDQATATSALGSVPSLGFAPGQSAALTGLDTPAGSAADSTTAGTEFGHAPTPVAAGTMPIQAPATTAAGTTPTQEPAPTTPKPTLFQGHKVFRENQRGVSYDTLFGEYLKGARRIEIIDPFIRTFHQCRNLMELLEVALRNFDYKVPTLEVHLVTGPDEYDVVKQREYLRQIAEIMAPLGLNFTYQIDMSGALHARHLKIDNSWDILLDRGLDIFQKFDIKNAFAIENRMPEMRRVRQFEVTYLKKD